MKYDWRKTEKDLYLPKRGKAFFIEVPEFLFLRIKGHGDPNGEAFQAVVGTLFSASYALKMYRKKQQDKKELVDYAVYPLEAVLLMPEDKTFHKNDLQYEAMIRQPGCLEEALVQQILDREEARKPQFPWDRLELVRLREGPSVQMLHTGPYDEEHLTFDAMERYCLDNNLERLDATHREIYLSDPRRCVPEKWRTVLRYQVIGQ